MTDCSPPSPPARAPIPPQSYTAKLLAAGVEKCAKKFGEEATETVIAAIQKDKTELAKESADVLYHLAVLWAASGITPEDVYAVLKSREGMSGLEEKAQPRSEATGILVCSSSSARLFTRSSTRLRTLASLIFMNARLSCSPSPLETNSITGGAPSPRPPAG